MGYRMNGFSGFGEGTSPAKQRKVKEVPGEGTGLVKKDKKGKQYAIYGGRSTDLGKTDIGFEGGTNPYTGNPTAMPGDTVFVGKPTHLFSSTPAGKGHKKGDDDFIFGGEHKVKETEPSKKRKKGPKSYETQDDAPNKMWAQVAGAVIGANKRRQASKDEADAAKAQGIQAAFANKKL